ncbi:hypothetical protein EDC01DRAFT_119326 [Geopyxis carbonaria]|nr:hypothetical protein EDC01DRAFT_119326 [Geopyxis carbonaria]
MVVVAVAVELLWTLVAAAAVAATSGIGSVSDRQKQKQMPCRGDYHCGPRWPRRDAITILAPSIAHPVPTMAATATPDTCAHHTRACINCLSDLFPHPESVHPESRRDPRAAVDGVVFIQLRVVAWMGCYGYRHPESSSLLAAGVGLALCNVGFYFQRSSSCHAMPCHANPSSTTTTATMHSRLGGHPYTITHHRQGCPEEKKTRGGDRGAALDWKELS